MEKENYTRVWYERDKSGKLTGKTVVVVWDGENRYAGISTCAAEDQVDKKKGRTIALGRARIMQDTHRVYAETTRADKLFCKKMGYKFRMGERHGVPAPFGFLQHEIDRFTQSIPPNLYMNRPKANTEVNNDVPGTK